MMHCDWRFVTTGFLARLRTPLDMGCEGKQVVLVFIMQVKFIVEEKHLLVPFL